MKVYIPTHNRASTILNDTLALFPQAELLVHSQHSAGSYRAAGVEQPIHVTGAAPPHCGKAHSVRSAMEFADYGEWVVFLDDDISGAIALPKPYYDKKAIAPDDYRENKFVWDHRFDTPAQARIVEIWEDTIAEAERVGANMAGFSPTGNNFFRLKKWSYHSMVRGWMFLVRKVKGRELRLCGIDDIWWSLDYLQADGKVVINKYLWTPHLLFEKNQRGAFSHTLEERRRYSERAARRVLREYGDYVRTRKKQYCGVLFTEIVLTGKRFHPKGT